MLNESPFSKPIELVLATRPSLTRSVRKKITPRFLEAMQYERASDRLRRILKAMGAKISIDSIENRLWKTIEHNKRYIQ